MESIGEMRKLKLLEMGDGTLDLWLQTPERNTQGRLARLSDSPGLESVTKQEWKGIFNEHTRLHGARGVAFDWSLPRALGTKYINVSTLV